MTYQNTASARAFLAQHSTGAMQIGEPSDNRRETDTRRRNLVPIDFRDRRSLAMADRRAA
jgi:hypothetical protein